MRTGTLAHGGPSGPFACVQFPEESWLQVFFKFLSLVTRDWMYFRNTEREAGSRRDRAARTELVSATTPQRRSERVLTSQYDNAPPPHPHRLVATPRSVLVPLVATQISPSSS